MYYVYLLECSDQSIYTGITTDIDRRLKEHQEAKTGKGANYTSAKGAVKIVYSEEHPDRSSATKREAEIKKMSRQEKLELIAVSLF
jgi:putative endonuclease